MDFTASTAFLLKRWIFSSETLLSFMAYGILVVGKQMTSRGLSYTANAGFFDLSCGIAQIILTGTKGEGRLSPGSYTGFFVMGKEAFICLLKKWEVSIYV